MMDNGGGNCMKTNKLHTVLQKSLRIIVLLFALSLGANVALGQTFTAKLISANGSAWGQTNHIEKTSKGNDVYIGEKDPSTFNTTGYPYIKARLAYLSNDKMGSCSIRSLQRTTFEEGSVITSDPSRYYRKTCLSESYDKDWLDWASETEKTNAININATYPAIVYAYSVADEDVYDVYFYVSDDSDPFVSGTCQKLFKVGPDEYEGIYEDLSGLAHWYFNDVTDLSQMFSQDGKLKKIGLNGNFSNVSTITSMFENCRSLEEINIVSTSGDFGTSITDMSKLFQGCESLKSITFMGSFDNVTNISSMFSGCTNLETAKIGTFNKDKLKTANNVFDGCTSIKSFSTDPDSDADVKLISSGFSNVETFASMFNGCTSLEDVEIKGTFSNLISTNSMFKGCSALTSAIIDGDDFGNALTEMQSMFFGCTALPSVSLTGDFSKVQKMTSMFYNCSSLASAILDGNFGEELTSMASMFYGCSSITSATIYDAGEDSDAAVQLSGDFSNVTTLENVFKDCSSLTDVDIKTDFENLTKISNIFASCNNLTTAKIDGKFEKLTSLNSLFKDKTKLTTAVIKGEFPLITNLAYLFQSCSSLTSAIFEGTLSEDVASISMESMFSGCSAITSATIYDAGEESDAAVQLSGDFSKVTTLKNLFQNCSSLRDVDIKTDFENVTNISNIFASCNNLTTAKIDGKFEKLTALNSLFGGRTNLTTAVIKGEFPLVTTLASLFYNCTALSSAIIEADFPKVTTTQEMLKNCDAITSALFNVDGDADVVIKGDFPKLTNMNGTMRECDKLTTATINLPDAATNVNNFFKSSKLTSATVDNFKSVTTMESMFSSCTNLTDVTLNGDFSKVTTVKEIFNSSTAVSSVSLNDGDADFNSLTSLQNMVNNWPIAKYDVFSDIISQMRLNTSNLPGATNANHQVINNNKSGWTSKKVKTKNNAEYDVTNGYLATFLPIELTYFEVSQQGEELFFEWETATETNNDYFTIEQSLDGVSFHEIARITGAGTTSSYTLYEYSYPISIEGIVYFRLKQTDYNGDYSYSNIKTIDVVGNSPLRMYPIPALAYITIEGDYESVQFVDVNGVIHTPQRAEGNTYPLTSFPKGMFFAIVTMRNGEIVTRQFLHK